MATCVDYGFDGAVKPCLGDRPFLETFRQRFGENPEPRCIGSDCPWKHCCNLRWRNASLSEVTAPLSGRMVAGGAVGQEAGGEEGFMSFK